MCGASPKAPPAVVQRDPVAEQQAAEAKAQQDANAETASRRRRRSWTAGLSASNPQSASLGGGNAAQSKSLLAQATPQG